MRKLIFFGTFLCVVQFQAQQRVITTGVPFLLISADARSAGMADMGVASSADAYSQQSNAAKYAFSKASQGLALSYTPYLTSIANDISLGQLNYFNRFNEKSAFGASLRYFSIGEIQLTDSNANSLGSVKPAEFAVDLSYSLKLSEKFSMSVGGRYINSNLRLATEGSTNDAASSFAVDVTGFYQSEEFALSSFNSRWRAGFNLQNLGPKINYDLDQSERGSNFLPSMLKVGASYDFILDEYNTISVIGESTKLLVPTPKDVSDLNGDGIINATDRALNDQEYRKISWTSGIFNSFGDAPGGFSEELKEFTWALGAEYWYQESFGLRTGYFNENVNKGARKYFTLGAGFKYNTLKLDVSYLFSASKIRNPLENTLRFSLTFNFGDKFGDL